MPFINMKILRLGSDLGYERPRPTTFSCETCLHIGVARGAIPLVIGLVRQDVADGLGADNG